MALPAAGGVKARGQAGPRIIGANHENRNVSGLVYGMRVKSNQNERKQTDETHPHRNHEINPPDLNRWEPAHDGPLARSPADNGCHVLERGTPSTPCESMRL